MADYDPQEIFGAGCRAAVLRVFGLFFVIFSGTAIGYSATVLAEITHLLISMDLSGAIQRIVDGVKGVPFAFLMPFISMWGIAYILTLMATFLFYIKLEEISWKVATSFTVIYATLTTRSITSGSLTGSPLTGLETILSVIFLMILLASAGAGLFYYHGWQANRFARHLEAVRAENELKRQTIQKRFGTTAPRRPEDLPIPPPQRKGTKNPDE